MKFNFKAAAALLLALVMTGCANDHYTRDGGEITTSVIKEIPPEETSAQTAEVTDLMTTTTEETAETLPLMLTDREGNDIFVPDEINTVVSLSPIVTELLEGLEVTDRIIAADTGSAVIGSVDPALCTLDKAAVTAEELAALGADVFIAGGTFNAPENEQLAALRDMGVKVLFIPYSNSFSSIKLDIEFLASYTGTEMKGQELVRQIDEALAAPYASSMELPMRKVYLETSPAPSMQSAGSGTLFGEILTLIGAENIYASRNGYIVPENAAVIEADPDVIISNVHAQGYDVNEIAKRQGWNRIKAVKDGKIFRTSSVIRPTHKITEYIREISGFVYPELYREETVQASSAQ